MPTSFPPGHDQAAYSTTAVNRPSSGILLREANRQLIAVGSVVAPIAIVALIALLPAIPRRAVGQERHALHEEIDQAIARVHLGPQAEVCDDYEFLRRIYLDLIGRIPSVDELDEFLEAPAASRRQDVVDRLLASEACNRHLATRFDLMWMERRKDQYVTTEQWRDYLTDCFATNQPLNQLVADILAADGRDPTNRAAAKFLLDREVEAHALTRDISRMFFGRDIQCAQCHDHPLISDYSQAEYHGLLAFVHRSYRMEEKEEDANGKANNVSYVGEKPSGEVSFSSVFEPAADPQWTLPALPNGVAFDQERLFRPVSLVRHSGQESQPVVSADSRRLQLAQIARKGENIYFRRNLANRLWRIVMKQGLVEPPDLMHPDNPPIYPLLLDRLAEALVNFKFDAKAFLRQIVLTNAYQRKVELPTRLGAQSDEKAIRTQSSELKSELAFQEAIVARQKDRQRAAGRQLRRARDELIAIRKKMQAILATRQQAEEKRAQARKNLKAVQQRLTKAESLMAAAAQTKQAAQGEDDQDLQEVARILNERAASVSQQLEKNRQQVQQHETELADADAEIQTCDDQLVPLSEKRTAQTIAVKQLSGAYRALFEVTTAEEARAIQFESQATLLDLVQKHSQLKQAGERIQSEVETIQTCVCQLQSEMESSASSDETTTETDSKQPPEASRLKKLRNQLVALQERGQGNQAEIEQVVGRWRDELARRFVVAKPCALLPEQMAASVFQACELDRRFRAEAVAEWEAKHAEQLAKQAKQQEATSTDNRDSEQANGEDEAPATAETEIDATQRQREIDAILEKKRGRLEASIVPLFSATPGSPQDSVQPTVDQALFLSNDSRVQSWIRPAHGNLADRLRQISDDAKLANQMYLAILTRPASSDEGAAVVAYLDSAGDQRSAAIQELIWSLISSVEFRFHH